MGENIGASSQGIAHFNRNGSRADRYSQNVSGDFEMQSDETTLNRSRGKRVDAQFDMRSGIGDLREGINSTRDRASNEMRLNADLRSQIGGDTMHDIARNASNHADMEDTFVDEPVSTNIGKSSGSNRKPIEASDAQLGKVAFSKPIFSKNVPAVKSTVQVSPASSMAAEGRTMMPPPKSRNTITSPRATLQDEVSNMPPPANQKHISIFGRKSNIVTTPRASVSDHTSQHSGSLTPRMQPSSPILRADP